MFSNNSSIDSNLKKLLAPCHKETQTTNAALKESGITTNSSDPTCDKESLKVFEFSELIQDPNRPRDITIIKDVYTEESHNHANPNGPASDEAIANRYTYRREVIKPYLKDYPRDCHIADEQLIRGALDAAHEDFPDYEACFEGYDNSPSGVDGKSGALDKNCILHLFDKKKKEDTENKCPIVGKIIVRDDECSSFKCSLSTKDKVESGCCTFKDEKKSSSSKSCLNKDRSPNSPKKSTDCLISNMDSDKACPPPEVPKKRDHRCPKKAKCPPPVDPCFNPDDPPPGPPSACKNRTTEGIPCKKTPSTESAGPCSDKTMPSKEKEKICLPRNDITSAFSCPKSVFAKEPEERRKTMMEAHSETIATIKSAVEDFFGKVYRTTKEAVTVIRTESAKHLGKMTAKKSASSNADLVPHKVHENKSSDTITSFNYFKTDDPSKPESKSDTDENWKKAGKAIGKIFATVDSTISTLSDHIDLEKMSSILKFEAKDESSPYDRVASDDESVEDGDSMSLPNSVFKAIKSKIASMFSESDLEGKGPRSSGSTESSRTRR